MISIVNKLRQFGCNPFVKRITRRLHLRGFMRKIYFILWPLAVPKNKIKVFYIDKIKAHFFINEPSILNMVESKFFERGPGAERNILNSILSLLRPKDVAFDVGANVGVYTVFMAKKVGGDGIIVAFEPEKNNFELLKKNININNLNNVRFYPLALGERTHEGLLLGSGPWSRISHFSKEKKGKKVKVVPGDKIVKRDNLGIPTLIKIDVEGFEYQVIKGLNKTLSNKNCKFLICEIHPKLLPENKNYEEIIKLLKAKGFSRFKSYQRDEEIHLFCYKS
jgi:FkbM family methyltransferase